jgi:Sec-independent protein translocase protein TatA
MGDFAKGIKAFKSGMKEDEEAEAPLAAPQLAPAAAIAASPAKAEDGTLR